MALEFNTDVCVIGAGPGGCAIAKRLAALGYAVTCLQTADVCQCLRGRPLNIPRLVLQPFHQRFERSLIPAD